jgi:hypothetical protein
MFGLLDVVIKHRKFVQPFFPTNFLVRRKTPILILEAICSQNLWVWHAFICMVGANNDINVINCSTMFVNLLSRALSQVDFQVNGYEYKIFYLLTNGICTNYTCSIKPIHHHQGHKRKWFAKMQKHFILSRKIQLLIVLSLAWQRKI